MRGTIVVGSGGSTTTQPATTSAATTSAATTTITPTTRPVVATVAPSVVTNTPSPTTRSPQVAVSNDTATSVSSRPFNDMLAIADSYFCCIGVCNNPNYPSNACRIVINNNTNLMVSSKISLMQGTMQMFALNYTQFAQWEQSRTSDAYIFNQSTPVVHGNDGVGVNTTQTAQTAYAPFPNDNGDRSYYVVFVNTGNSVANYTYWCNATLINSTAINPNQQVNK